MKVEFIDAEGKTIQQEYTDGFLLFFQSYNDQQPLFFNDRCIIKRSARTISIYDENGKWIARFEIGSVTIIGV